MTDDDALPPFHGEIILGDVTADRLRGRLAPRLGELSEFRLVSLDAPPMPIARWEAIDADGREVSGEVVHHHVVDGDRITMWVETGPVE